MCGALPDYFDKYLSSDRREKKKKNKEKNIAPGLSLIDDDAGLQEFRDKETVKVRSKKNEVKVENIWKKLGQDVEELVSAGASVSIALGEGTEKELGIFKQPKSKNPAVIRKVEEEEKTIYRDKYGKKINVEFELEKLKREEEILEEGKKEDKMWSVGISQLTSGVKKAARLQEEKNVPFAFYADDNIRDEELKSRVLWGDPCMKASKEENKDAQVYKGPAPMPNRYDIQPGYRWDGIDRSNGFEKKLFLERNRRKALKTDAYMWSSEDL